MAFDETIGELEVEYEHPASSGVVWPRLLIGLYVLICAEVFSGASLQVGIWHPWTLLVTYWLYFAHFFFFTTLAVRTGRTSLWSLYLWGVLFGLYESWITKVIRPATEAMASLPWDGSDPTGSPRSAWWSSFTRSCRSRSRWPSPACAGPPCDVCSPTSPGSQGARGEHRPCAAMG